MEKLMKNKFILFLALAATLGAVGRAEAQSPPSIPGEAAVAYRIGPEDVLQISVFSNEALSRTVPVRPDGMISLPLLNDVKAAGLTPMELRDAIMKRLVEFVPSPEVAVIVTEVKSFMISVIGQVVKPGRYDLRSSATIVDALAMAGGFKEFAGRSKIIVTRTQGGVTKRIPFNYDKLDETKNPQVNFDLRPGDIVIVP